MADRLKADLHRLVEAQEKRGQNMGNREEFYFDSRDMHSRIHAVQWTPEGNRPMCILQIVHGMAEYVERYAAFAEYLNEQNILVVGEDHLGHGKSVGENGKYGYFCERDAATVVVRDVHRLKKITQEKYPGVPYFILGHSMGSFILRNYLCRYGTGIEGAVIMGTGMQPKGLLKVSKALVKVLTLLQGAKHESRLVDKLAFGNFNKGIVNPSSKNDWLSADSVQVAKYNGDPMCGFLFTLNGFGTLFELIWRLHDPAYLEKMPKDLPLLLTAGARDPVGDYGKAVEEVYQSYRDMGMGQVQLKLYPEGRHEILNETNRQQVYEDISRWLCATAASKR